MTYTAAEVEAIRERLEGASIDTVEVTVFGDREPRFLILTPRCAYCGSLNPFLHCRACGAGPVAGA